MRATKAAALARPAHERISLDHLDVEADAQRVYVVSSGRVLAVLKALGRKWAWVRRRKTDDASRALTDVAADIVELWNAGATEAELRHFEIFVAGVIDSCSVGRAVRPIHDLDREEQQLECEETALQVARLSNDVAGKPTPVAQLEHEADIGEREAMVEIEKGRALRRMARQALTRSIDFPMDRAMSRTTVQS